MNPPTWSSNNAILLMSFSLASGGCVPMTQLPSVDSPEVIKQGSFSIAIAAGLAGGSDPIPAGGARVKIGLGADNEIGAQAIFLSGTGQNKNYELAGKLFWRIGLLGGVMALSTGVGLIGLYNRKYETNVLPGWWEKPLLFTIDVGAVFGAPRPIGRFFRPYGGFRFALVPQQFGIGSEFGGLGVIGANGNAFSLAVLGGLSFEPAQRIRIYAEAGYLSPIAGYGAVGLGFMLGKMADEKPGNE